MSNRLTRGLIVIAMLAFAVSALVVAWGDAPAVASALRSFPTRPDRAGPPAHDLELRPALAALELLPARSGRTGVGNGDSALVFLSGFAMGLTPGKSGELTKSYWLREIAGPEQRTRAAHCADCVRRATRRRHRHAPARGDRPGHLPLRRRCFAAGGGGGRRRDRATPGVATRARRSPPSWTWSRTSRAKLPRPQRCSFVCARSGLA